MVEPGVASPIVLFGVGERPLRATAAEQVLGGGGTPAEVGRLAAAGIDPVGDIHASAEYRREAVAELVSAAVAEARERCA